MELGQKPIDNLKECRGWLKNFLLPQGLTFKLFFGLVFPLKMTKTRKFIFLT